MNLDQIRTKLNHQASNPRQTTAAPPIDWPDTHLSRRTSRSSTMPSETSGPAKLFTAVETLKQRASLPGVSLQPPRPISSPTSDADLEEPALQEVTMHFKRLKTLADKINFLSSEQEHIMAEIRTVQSRLQLLRPYLRATSEEASRFPNIDLDGAVLASAESDPHANLVMTYRSAMIPHPEQDAQDLANHLRGAYGGGEIPQKFTWPALVSDFGMVWQEPADLIGLIWREICSFGSDVAHKKTGRASRSKIPDSQKLSLNSLSLVDMLLWFGGGFVGRFALNLVLSAFPGLWSIAVAVLTAITAYALYRATLAPRRDFGFAYRVFLALAGLVIGGHL